MPQDTAPQADAVPHPEQLITIQLGSLYSTWQTLAGHHPEDDAEFRRCINTLHKLIAFRCARRTAPDTYATNPLG